MTGSLTETEVRRRRIVALVEQGLTFKEIEQATGIKERTVRWHCDQLRLILGVDRKRRLPEAFRARYG